MESESSDYGEEESRSSTSASSSGTEDPEVERVLKQSLHRKKEMMRRYNLSPFGPRQPGCLFLTKYRDHRRSLETSGALLFPTVTLNYMEGRKYTLGNTFISRESQGVFIFLLGSCGDMVPYDGNFFTLECKSDCLWISCDCDAIEGLCPWASVAVNNVPLTANAPLERILKFDDIVTITVDSTGPKGPFYAKLVFKIPSLHPSTGLFHSDNMDFEKEGNESERGCRVLEIPLIVQNILSCLPTQSVQSLRSLSWLWNVEGLKVLRDQVRVTAFQICVITAFWSDDLMQIPNFAFTQLNSLRFPHWKIKVGRDRTGFFQERYQEEAKIKAAREPKLLDDLVWFFDPERYIHCLRSLDLIGEVESETSIAMLQTILRGVSNSLTTLKLELDCLCDTFPSTPLGFDLSRLRSLHLSGNVMKSTPQPCWKPYLKWLLSGMGSVENLCFIAHPHSTTRLGTLALVEIIRIQESNPTRFANLTSITIDCKGDIGFLGPMSLLRVNGLRSLDLRGLPPAIINLRPVLQHFETLEKMSLHFDTNWNPGRAIRLALPERLQKLSSLSVFLSLETEETDDAVPISFTFGHVPIPAGNGDDDEAEVFRIDYRRHFPSLVKLEVSPVDVPQPSGGLSFVKLADQVSWKRFVSFMSTFVHPRITSDGPITPVPNMQILDIPFQLKTKYHRLLDDLEATFPNVVFPPDLAAARQGPAWTEDDEESTTEDEILGF